MMIGLKRYTVFYGEILLKIVKKITLEENITKKIISVICNSMFISIISFFGDVFSVIWCYFFSINPINSLSPFFFFFVFFIINKTPLSTHFLRA